MMAVRRNISLLLLRRIIEEPHGKDLLRRR